MTTITSPTAAQVKAMAALKGLSAEQIATLAAEHGVELPRPKATRGGPIHGYTVSAVCKAAGFASKADPGRYNKGACNKALTAMFGTAPTPTGVSVPNVPSAATVSTQFQDGKKLGAFPDGGPSLDWLNRWLADPKADPAAAADPKAE